MIANIKSVQSAIFGFIKWSIFSASLIFPASLHKMLGP
jgi:hypothetical protein